MTDVILKKPHTHAGRTYPAGATLRGLRTDQTDWLVALGVAEAVRTTDEQQPEAGSDAQPGRRAPIKNAARAKE
jgi:hypothetical protein